MLTLLFFVICFMLLTIQLIYFQYRRSPLQLTELQTMKLIQLTCLQRLLCRIFSVLTFFHLCWFVFPSLKRRDKRPTMIGNNSMRATTNRLSFRWNWKAFMARKGCQTMLILTWLVLYSITVCHTYDFIYFLNIRRWYAIRYVKYLGNIRHWWRLSRLHFNIASNAISRLVISFLWSTETREWLNRRWMDKSKQMIVQRERNDVERWYHRRPLLLRLLMQPTLVHTHITHTNNMDDDSGGGVDSKQRQSTKRVSFRNWGTNLINARRLTVNRGVDGGIEMQHKDSEENIDQTVTWRESSYYFLSNLVHRTAAESRTSTDKICDGKVSKKRLLSI